MINDLSKNERHQDYRELNSARAFLKPNSIIAKLTTQVNKVIIAQLDEESKKINEQEKVLNAVQIFN